MLKRNYEDIKIGEKASFGKTITEADILAFCGVSGDHNPIHVNETFARASRFGARIAHGMMVASLGNQPSTEIVGQGGVHVSQEVSFKAPVMIGDTITVESEVTEKMEEKRRLIITTTWTNQDGKVVITGRGEHLLPRPR